MKTTKQTNATEKQRLMGEVRLARLQLAKAESQLVEAKEQARLARRRRKEAKQNARRAKKQVRQAKENVDEVKLALAKIEAKLVRPNPTRSKRNSRRSPAKKIVAAPSRKNPVVAVVAPPRKPLKVRKPVARRPKFKRKPGPAGKTAKRATIVTRDLETPIHLIPPEISKATGQIVKGVEKIFTGESLAEAAVGTGAQAKMTPPDRHPSTPNQNLNNTAINPQEAP
jgi:hypothetical protein